MMAIVVALLGAFHCGATFAQARGDMVWNIAPGIAFVACGLALMVMFGRVARKTSLDAGADIDRSPALPVAPLGTAILVVGTLVALLGAVGAVLAWRDPFSWMMAIVGLVVFIDALCLRISLSSRD